MSDHLQTNELPVITETGVYLRPDTRRVVIRFFVPGREDVGPGDSRAAPVIERVMALSEPDVTEELADVVERFAHRHDDLVGAFDRHASRVQPRLEHAATLSHDRRRLMGAVFSHEYAIEGAALCNPSMVAHPVQPVAGETAFVMSVRGIGEGHRSSIGFREGVVRADGRVDVAPTGPHARIGSARPGTHHRSVLHRMLAALDDDHENAALVLDPLPEHFDDHQLAERLTMLSDDADTRRHAAVTGSRLTALANSSYVVDFPSDSRLSERVLWPGSQAEAHGMEDARFVEIVDGSAPRYCATYTAFDGRDIGQHLLTTDDFVTFDVSAMAGAAARGKGLALFPRQVGGRYVALSRSDRETNSLTTSDDLRCWDEATLLQAPERSWELLQLGNCGSPIETSEGWLVLTHGVGAMRTYAIGAVLLDLDDPGRLIASTAEPIVRPQPDGRDGYVPNVLYTCGAMAVGDLLVLPFGVGDQTISIVTLSVSDLIGSMQRVA